MTPLGALCIAAAASGAPTPTGSAGVRVGAGFASNLDHAEVPSEAASGAAWRVDADGAVGLQAGDWWGGLSLQGGYAGWPAWPALSSAAAALALPVSWSPTPRVGLGLLPRLTARWVADDARSALGPGIGGSAKVRPTRAWSVRTSLSYSWVPATEAVFDERTLRWAAGTELHPWRRTWIYGEYGLSGGPTVVYDVIPTTTTSARKTGAGGGQGGDGQGDGQGGDGKPAPVPDPVFGTDVLARQVPGLGHDVLLEVEQGFTDWSFVRVWAGWSRWSVAPAAFEGWTGGVALGVRTK
jgi:hypothetical protein